MARIFDVVEYANEMHNVIAYHFPETGVADLRFGSQVIVRESQSRFLSRWESSRRSRTGAAYDLDRELPAPDESPRRRFQRAHAVYRGSFLRFDARVRRREMGNVSADYRPKYGRRSRRQPSSRFRDVLVPGRRSAAVHNADRWIALLIYTGCD